MRTYRQDVDEEQRYGFDWSNVIPTGERITASSWEVALGLTTDNATYTDLTTDIDISGGTLNNTYLMTNEITTSRGLTHRRSISVMVVDR